MSDQNNIPKHWQIKKLGEVCLTTSGGTPNRSQSKYYNGNIPWVKSGELDKGLITDTEERISEEAIKNSSAKVFPKGTLLIALYGATIGKLAFLGIDAATNQAVCGIFKNENINSLYLYHFLFFKKASLAKQSIGGAQPNINQGILKNLEIPLPPITEQTSIVSKIEELLSDLENGKQQLQLAQQQLRVYRQSLLKWAFEGKLTNENIEVGELPNGWKIVELKDVANKITDGEHFRPKVQDNGIPFLSAKDVRDWGVSFNEPLYISEDTAKKALGRCNPQRGDILIVSRGATVGRMCIVNTDRQFCLLGSVILIKVNKIINPKLLNFILKSPIANQKMITISGATAQQAIYLRDIKFISIPLPPYEEQQEIVHELESKLTVCNKIEETINQSLQHSETLRQSILKKAFEGKLVNLPDK